MLMKTFVSVPKGANFDTFFTKENIALLESFGEVIWNPTEKQMLPEEIADAIGNSGDCQRFWFLPQ